MVFHQEVMYSNNMWLLQQVSIVICVYDSNHRQDLYKYCLQYI